MPLARLAMYALWIVPVLLQIGILIFMLRRNLRQVFPWFFHYTTFQVLSNVILYYLFHFGIPEQYFYTYWGSDAISAMLGFAVIREIFNNAFGPFDALRDLANIMFKWAALMLVIVAVALASSSRGGSDEAIFVVVLAIERGVMVIQGGLLLFLLLFSGRLGISWKNHCFGLSLGFGIYASTLLIVESLRSQLGPQWNATCVLLQSSCYAAAVLVWTSYIFSPEPVRAAVESRFEPKPVLQRWNEALRGNLPVGESAFFTDMEQIVDRVLSHEQESKLAG